MHIIKYGSRVLMTVGGRYTQTKHEALVIVWACEHFHIFVYSKSVSIYTGDKPLVAIYGNRNQNPSTY